jgi:hypothetical protein
MVINFTLFITIQIAVECTDSNHSELYTSPNDFFSHNDQHYHLPTYWLSSLVIQYKQQLQVFFFLLALQRIVGLYSAAL